MALTAASRISLMFRSALRRVSTSLLDLLTRARAMRPRWSCLNSAFTLRTASARMCACSAQADGEADGVRVAGEETGVRSAGDAGAVLVGSSTVLLGVMVIVVT